MWYAGGVNDTAVCTASTISLESSIIILGIWKDITQQDGKNVLL